MSVIVSLLNIVNASCQSKLLRGSGWLGILWPAWHFSFTTRLSGLIYFDIFLPRRKLTKKDGGNSVNQIAKQYRAAISVDINQG